MSACQAFSQNSAGDASTIEPRQLIDIPTAGMLKRGSFSLDVDFFQQGGMTMSMAAGALDRLMFGISYGGTGVIGSGSAVMQPLPGVMLKYRIIDESMALPAIAVGFESQGKESYIDSTQRFTIKSRGVFAAASKNYSFLGNLSIHGGMNWSMERKDDDSDLDFFVGIEKTIGPEISLFWEYDFALNDNGPRSLGRGNGYMNAGVRWSFGNGFALGFDLKNVVKNQEYVTIGNRTLKVEWVRTL